MLKAVYANIRDNLLHEAERWVLWLPVFFGAGIGVYFSLYDEPEIFVAPALIAIAIIFLIISRHNFALKYLSIIFLTVALGFAAAKTNA
jgi:competence protein ComEC